MDRTEYRERMTRIDGLLMEEKNEEALDLLDSINWEKLHNVNYLLDGAERYERLSKMQDAKELLEIAHERSPIGRMIIFRLGIVCAHLHELEEADLCYEKFIALAPNDNIRFIMKYEISRAKNAEDTVLISILEELRANELVEEWAFELACLYRKTGQIDKCVALLDEIILWFGEGPYVEKAYEIKLKYRPLSKEQEIRYRNMKSSLNSMVEIHPGDILSKNEFLNNTIRIPEIEEDNEKFNTQNLQEEIRKNIDEIMKASEVEEISGNMEAIKELIEEVPHVQLDEEENIEKIQNDNKKIDANLKSKFEEYLLEEFDGQISLVETGHEKKDEQIDGQLTIEDFTREWEKTKRAAEMALSDAKEQELNRKKEDAIAKASDVLDKLKEVDSEESPKAFHIPVINSAAGEESFEIPIISSEKVEKESEQVKEPEPEKDAPKEEALIDTKDWTPPALLAEKALKDINAMLQNEIDKFSEPAKNKEEGQEPKDNKEENSQNTEDKEPANEDKEIIEDEISENLANEELIQKEAEEEEALDELPKIDTESITDTKDPEDFLRTGLTDSQKEALSYFAGISGMEEELCDLIEDSKTAIRQDKLRDCGHFVIVGVPGSGKTRLAQNIIKVLKAETGKLSGNIGKIDSGKLNEKDVSLIMDKVTGGALIIQNAGKLSKETMVSLTINIEKSEKTLVVLEDTKEDLARLFKENPRFAKKFTGDATIPDMKIDELVKFAKIYAAEHDYAIEEMGILALYDRINIISLPGSPTTVKDVKGIVDSAIISAENSKSKKGLLGGLFNKADAEFSGPTLQERDFRKD